MKSILTAILVFAWCAAAGRVDADQPSTSMSGEKVGSFALQDFRGKRHSLDDLSDSRLVVIAVLGVECPLAKLYAGRMNSLAREFQSRGVAFLGLNANRHDSITEIAASARHHKISFPILKDAGNRVADALHATRTPEVFVLDEQRIVRYHGRVDDQYGVGYVRDEPTRHDLRTALEELLAGETVSVAETTAVGCLIGRIREPNENNNITYSNRIAHILQNRCVECHRSGQIAPFALTDYDEVAGWADMIDEVVQEQRMPPWHASPDYGHFANDRRMTSAEKSAIADWVAAGAPEGDPADLPEPPQYVDDWQLPGKPDLVFDIHKEPFVVPAEGALEYQYFSVDPNFTKDTWVQACEIRPGNMAVVHHILMWVVPPGGTLRDMVAATGGFLFAYVPGMRPYAFAPGMAKVVPAGSELVFQVHYTPIGTEQKDSGRIGLVLTDADDVTTKVMTLSAEQHKLKIPAREANHREEAVSRELPEDRLLLGMMAHAHLRGKSFRYEALYPDGTTEILLDIPDYDFNWQTLYRLTEPKPLPAFTRIRCVARYDNSEKNLSNPDPTVDVIWGSQTSDEMLIGYFDGFF